MTKTKTYLNTLLGGAAALALFAAGPAFAQDSYVDTQDQVHTDKSEMADTLDQAADDIDAVADELESEDDTLFGNDPMTDDLEDDEMLDDTMEETTTGESTAVVCPEGTEVQEDGTCRVTEEWTPEG